MGKLDIETVALAAHRNAQRRNSVALLGSRYHKLSHAGDGAKPRSQVDFA